MTTRSRSRFVSVLVAALVVATAAPPASAATAAACAGRHWVGSWSASMGHVNDVGYAFQTLRMIVYPHLAGGSARVRLANPLTDNAVTLAQVRLGRSRFGGAALERGSTRPVTFGGRAEVTIPAGGEVASDPVTVPVEPFRPLAVSLYAATPTGPVSEHFDGHQLSWIAPGAAAADESGLPFVLPTFKWSLLAGVDVSAPRRTGAVVTLGDSITDGFQNLPAQLQTMGANHRYPDFLARRLLTAGADDVSVLNAGISGNQVTRDAHTTEGRLLGYGPSALNRLDRDVLTQPGVRQVIVMEGTNDLGQADPRDAAAIIGGLRAIVDRAHAAGLRVQLGTLPPRNDVSDEQVATLNEVNAWIRTQRVADGVIDFHAVLRDRHDPDQLNPSYDSGDGLHPNSAGYEAMAAAIDLDTLDTARCRQPVAVGAS